MPRGGARPGAGKPKGTIQGPIGPTTEVRNRRQAAAETGLLPHEWLLKVSRGEGIEHTYYKIEYNKNGTVKEKKIVTELVFADFATRIDAAKAAAPYYAPKLALQQVNVNNAADPTALINTFKNFADKLPV